MTRPFKILGVQQIAIGGPSKAALRGLWVDLLGVSAHSTFRSERENVDEDILALAGVEIDLMEPIDADKSPKVHEPRLNHLGLWVDNLAVAVEWLTQQGVRFTPGGPSADWTVVLRRSSHSAVDPGLAGITFELV